MGGRACLLKQTIFFHIYENLNIFRGSKEFQDCLIVATEGKYNPKPVAWLFQKHSPYLDIFNFYMNEFIEKGTWNAIQSQYRDSPQICPKLSGKPIEITTCFTAFLTLIVGSSIALIIIPFEHLHKKNKFLSKVSTVFFQNIQDDPISNKKLKMTNDSTFELKKTNKTTKHIIKQLEKNPEKVISAIKARGLGRTITWSIKQNGIHFLIKRD